MTVATAVKGTDLAALREYPIQHWKKHTNESKLEKLLSEEPLSIRIQGNPYAVVMRTPGNEIQHVAGFCLSEGIIDTPDDIANLSFCEGEDTNVVTVTLKSSRREKISQVLDRRGFVSQTSCGLCGKEIVKDLYQTIHPLTDNVRVSVERSMDCLKNLSKHQPLRQMTRAAHAAVLYDSNFEPLSAAEDVGRHNALDKAIGTLFLDHKLQKVALLTLSSRISYELVQKTARARIPIVLAISRPTSLAVELASKLNITLGSQAKDSGILIYCGEQRFK